MIIWCAKTQIISIIIIIISLIGFLSLIITGILYSILATNSYNISTTETPLLKKIKLKYENYFKLGLYTNQLQPFIDRYLHRKKVFKIPLYLWEHLAIELIYTVIVLSMLGTFINIIYYLSNNIKPLTNAFMVGILGFSIATIMLVIKVIFAVDTKKKIFYSNVSDYLENTLRNKLQNQCVEEVRDEQSSNEIQKMEKQNKSIQKNNKGIKNYYYTINDINNNISENKQQAKFKSDRVNQNLIDEVIDQIL